MRNRYRVVLVLILVLFAGVIAMPQAWKEKIPSEKTKEILLGKKIHYGLDLAGGSQLDFKVDMSRVQEKIAAGEDVQEDDVVNGVKSTLQRRIDPDGTRELNIYSSDFDGEKHIFVELTSDIDTPETREKLLKRIDLEFKEPNTEGSDQEKTDTEAIAKEALQKAEAGTSLSALETEYTPAEGETSFYQVSLREDQKKFKDQLPESIQEEMWGSEANTVFPKLFPTEGNYTIDQKTYQLRQIDGFSVAFVKGKEQADRTQKEPGEDFETVANEVSEDETREKTVDELPEDIRQTVLTQVQPNQISDVLEVDGKFAVYKLIRAEDENSPARVLQIVTSEKETAEKAHARVIEQEVTTQEEQMTYDELFFEVVPDQWKSTGLDGEYFKIAKPSQDQTNFPVVSIEFTNEGAEKFAELTERLVGQPMAIFVGGELISAPTIREKISGGAAQISFGTANYLEAQKEAIQLAEDLNAGAIPAPIMLDGELKIAASLGVDALQKSFLGAAIGFAILSLWLIFSYRILGVFAVFALCIYAILLVGILKFSPQFVLTLSGIAGSILSVGMAVDANVLIFERMREELRAGKNFSTALAVGFDRAWTSIRDANLTTLIVCGILYLFGTSMIKGFATMLAIGVLLSMFTAISVTRVLLKTIVGTKMSRNAAVLTKL